MWSSALTAVSLCALATASPLAIRQSSTEAQPLTYDTSICPGYTASNVSSDGTTITADLSLAGTACNAFSNDLTTLRLMVKYETNNRLHLQIYDPNEARYEVPEEVFPRPNDTSADASTLRFEHVDSPFSFAIIRNSTGEALFNSSGTSLVFENQYWRLRTTLPDNPNIYGLGEHTDPFHLPTEDYVRTMWSRDAFGIPNGTNLYGSHPVYSDYRETGTHSVALVNSNGMDIILNRTETGNYLEYNVIGGIIDLYFMEGPTPIEAAKQYAQLSGLPASIPYWGLGFHQCRYGYRDYVEVAQVIQNYSAAGIPLETQWTDIDYMYRRQVFTLDPEYFPLSGVQEVVNYLHANNQHYIVMVDPAVGILPGPPGETESAYTRGLDADVFMRYNESTLFYGVVWPGPTVYPDWFASNTTSYWNAEFSRFFDASSGVDIDGLWIDMNEPANFQNYCDAVCQQNPEAGAIEQAQISGNPPNRTTSPPAPGTPAFGSSASNMTRRSFNFDLELRADSLLEKRQSPTGASGSLGEGVATRANTTALNYISPGYTIGNVAGSLSNKSSDTSLVHQNGQIEYNTHNLYGSMMSEFSREAMLNRRPGLKTLVITRSTFLGAGRFVGKWLGDNLSNWQQYRESISGVLGFAAIQNMPVVGADVCGFGDNTTETLCARWASLGAFAYPFFRDHSNDGTIYQELYRWPIVAETARKAIGMRMRLLDYIYTGLHLASVDGTPLVQPLFFQYPTDLNTAPITLQLFMGSSLLVSPVTEENATSVTFYLPDDRFYDLFTFAAVEGAAANVTLEVPITDIPVHIKSGSIIPMRNESAMTTTELRTLPFQLVVAPSRNGTANGSLYLDDGVSIEQAATTEVEFAFNNNTLSITGQVGYTQGATLASVLFLGQSAALNATSSDGMSLPSTFNATSSVITVDLGNMTMAAMEITLA